MPPHHLFLRRSFEFFGTHASGTTVLARVAPDNAFSSLELRDASVAGAEVIAQKTHPLAILCPSNPLSAVVQPRTVPHFPGPSAARDLLSALGGHTTHMLCVCWIS